MEFSQLDDSKSSSDETDRSDQINDETGNGARSYGCVFCKRGFTTAQALGGHMNIHRKDRAKNRPSSVTPPMYDESSLSLRSFPMISSYPPYYTYTSAPEPYVRYPVFLPASTCDISRPSYNSHVHNELPFMQADLLNRDFLAEEYWRRNPDSCRAVEYWWRSWRSKAAFSNGGRNRFGASTRL